MNVLTNRKIKWLFCRLLVVTIIFTVISAALAGLKPPGVVFWVFLSSASMGISVLLVIYLYFREQNKSMEEAIEQIRDYISGNRNARIECDDEGELYRLFHEVNSLVSIINAHAENEGRSKKFMKDTLSDISHQLKTPLAALNVYNGLMQDETADISTLREFTELSEQELDRMETLVQNLLKIAKLDAGTILIDKAIEDVSEIMGCIEQHFTYQAGQEEKNLIFSGKDTITLFCDRNWLTEAISNIVKNAFNHTKKGAAIRVDGALLPLLSKSSFRIMGAVYTQRIYHIFLSGFIAADFLKIHRELDWDFLWQKPLLRRTVEQSKWTAYWVLALPLPSIF